MRNTKIMAFGLVAAATVAITACGSDGGDGGGAAADAKCPENLVIQTDWWPEVEHGGTYQLIGAGGTSDPKLFTYSGPINPKYAVGGIKTVEIRAGGDAIEFAPVTTEMQTDQSIYLGYVNTDDAISTADKVPVTGVATTLEINPQMIMWDPTQLTDIDATKPESFKASGARVVHFGGTTYIDWMISKGYLDAAQSDPSYGGSPDEWIAQGGNFVQQGFATNEIRKYETLVPWKDGAPADVEFALIHDLGWQPYPAVYSILSSRLEAEKGCLSALVPKLQQAWVDFLGDPKATGDQIVEVAKAYNNYWTVTDEINQGAYELFKSKGIGGNGADKTYGNFDDKRIEAIFAELKPILEGKAIALPAGFDAKSVYTNEFIDKSISAG
jgi:hypothetical protein